MTPKRERNLRLALLLGVRGFTHGKDNHDCKANEKQKKLLRNPKIIPELPIDTGSALRPEITRLQSKGAIGQTETVRLVALYHRELRATRPLFRLRAPPVSQSSANDGSEF